jgi:hypothetical protein
MKVNDAVSRAKNKVEIGLTRAILQKLGSALKKQKNSGFTGFRALGLGTPQVSDNEPWALDKGRVLVVPWRTGYIHPSHCSRIVIFTSHRN